VGHDGCAVFHGAYDFSILFDAILVLVILCGIILIGSSAYESIKNQSINAKKYKIVFCDKSNCLDHGRQYWRIAPFRNSFEGQRVYTVMLKKALSRRL